MKTVEISDNNDEQRFYEVINYPEPPDEELEASPERAWNAWKKYYDACPQCDPRELIGNPDLIEIRDSRVLCDDHFIYAFGDMLEEEDWASIKAKRGTAFVERWQQWIKSRTA